MGVIGLSVRVGNPPDNWPFRGKFGRDKVIGAALNLAASLLFAVSDWFP
jgi:hypothetical protein